MYTVKPIIVNNSAVPDYFENKLMNNTVYGIMLFPFIFVSPKKKIDEKSTYTYDQIIMHETIHFYQCLETFFFGFYFIYAFELLCNLIKHWDLWYAYLSVRFEVEAYSNMTTTKYLEKRDWYDWTSYMIFPDDTYNIEDLIDLHQLHPDENNSILVDSTAPDNKVESNDESEPVNNEVKEDPESEPVINEVKKEPESEPVINEVKEEPEPEPVNNEVIEEHEDVFNKSAENLDEEVSVSINRSLRKRSRKTQISID